MSPVPPGSSLHQLEGVEQFRRRSEVSELAGGRSRRRKRKPGKWCCQQPPKPPLSRFEVATASCSFTAAMNVNHPDAWFFSLQAPSAK
jgi:hypothetical protein